MDDYLSVVTETEALRVEAGLKPRSIQGEEGWFYVPRQVKGIRGVELRRPSNPGLQRHFEEAQEGVAAGIKYDTDPRATLELHVRQAYREIADAQLSDYLEPLSISAKQLVPEPILQNMSDAVLARRSAERELRSLRAQRLRLQTGGRFTGEEARAQQTLRAARQPERAGVQQSIKAAETRLDAVMKQYNAAKNRYSRALESARQREVAPGSLFGMAEENIPIAQWRNRFFPREQAEALREGVTKFAQRPEQSPFVSGVMKLGNTIRFLAAVGDFAEPFIQGLPTLFFRPRVWGTSTLRHYQAFFDPTVQARIMKAKKPAFQEMARHGTPIGDPEFFAALEKGQGFSPGKLLELAPKGEEVRRLFQQGGRQTFGRFQASYNTGLASGRALLTEALTDVIPDVAERQAFIRNLTGGLDSRALGVGPTQRALEGFYLAFSPRLLRSTVALVGDLRLGVRSARGRAAWEALSKLAAGTTALYVTTGLALGKDWDEIKTGLNPLNGKKFLSHEINGDWIGVGGQIRAITQLLAHSVANADNPEAFATLDPFENPILAFYSSRGAPALNINFLMPSGTSKGGSISLGHLASISSTTLFITRTSGNTLCPIPYPHTSLVILAQRGTVQGHS